MRVRQPAREPRLEPRLHRRPLGVDDRVGRGIAQAAVRHDPVIAQEAIELGAQPLDRRARLRVLLVRSQVHRDAFQRLERMAKHQVLGFGVDRRALERLADPGRADLQPPVQCLDVHVARGPDYLAAGAVDRHERQRHAAGEFPERLIDIGARGLGARDRRHLRFPHRAIGRGSGEGRRDRDRARRGHRLQPDMLAFERYRISEGHGEGPIVRHAT